MYNTYKFSLTSDVDQDVFISVYTYGDLQYVSTCYETFLESEVFVTSSAHNSELKLVNPGPAHLSMIQIQAGETVEVEVYTLFGEGDLLPHDW